MKYNILRIRVFCSAVLAWCTLPRAGPLQGQLTNFTCVCSCVLSSHLLGASLYTSPAFSAGVQYSIQQQHVASTSPGARPRQSFFVCLLEPAFLPTSHTRTTCTILRTYYDTICMFCVSIFGILPARRFYFYFLGFDPPSLFLFSSSTV